MNEQILFRVPSKYQNKSVKVLTLNFTFDLTEEEKYLNNLFWIFVAPMFFTKVSFQFLFSTKNFIENFVSFWFLSIPFKQSRKKKKRIRKFNLKKNKRQTYLQELSDLTKKSKQISNTKKK